MSSSPSKTLLNPHAPEYNAAVSSAPPPPPPTYFSTQIFTYVGPPPPPFYAANRTASNYYFSQQQYTNAVARFDYGQRRRTDFGQRRGFWVGGRGRGSSFNRNGRSGFMMNDRRQRMINNVYNNNTTNKSVWLKKEEKKEVKREVTPLKHDEHKTTVMIKNIPYHCPREKLIDLLDRFCMMENAKERNEGGTSMRVLEEAAAYDFFYLPIDFRTQKGRGYAFVNFTNTKSVWKFFNAFHLTHWDSVQWIHWPKKIEIVSAKIQGKEALVKHFAGSMFECETDEYLPVWFDPARDGSGKPVDVTVVGKRRVISHGASTRNNHKILRPGLFA